MKNHLFHNTHQLDDGVRLFDADPMIGNAWQRFQSGTHTPADLQLFRHELFGAKFEGIFKPNYRTSHAANRAGRSPVSNNMAVYLDIKKFSETSEVVEYTYSTTDERRGRFTINRETGKTCLLECASGEMEDSLYQRAAFKIKKAWKDGSLPDSICWAS